MNAINNYKLPTDKNLPVVFREFLSNAPSAFKIPSFFAAATCLSALATRVRVYYPYDGLNEHALLQQCIICGEQSSGKSFARNIENIVMRGLKERDNEQRREEQAYRELKQTASKIKTLPEPPKTVIRSFPISISIAQLIKRADSPQRYFGCPLTLWSWTDELSIAIESSRRAFSNIKSILRTSWDLHSAYGVDYLSENSYSATVDIIQCSLYLCTPNALDMYADKAFIEGGGASRTLLVKLPDLLGEEAPRFKIMTNEQEKSINEMLEKIDKDVYSKDGTINQERYIDMEWLYPVVHKWCKSQQSQIIRSGSRSHNVFYKRSSVIGFRIATLCAYLYMLESGSKNEIPKYTMKYIKNIYLFSSQYALNSAMSEWGNSFDEAAHKHFVNQPQTHVPLFEQLSNTFAREQIDVLIDQLKLSTPSKVFISKWKAQGLIKEETKHVYQKQKTKKIQSV